MLINTLAAICTLGLMSFAIKENPFFRFAETTFVGVATAHSLVISIETIKPQIFVPIAEQGKYHLVFAVILGLLMYSRFIKGKSWLMSYPLSIFVGIGVGLTLKGIIKSQIVNQIIDTVKPVHSIEALLMLIGVVSVLLFFFFSRKKGGSTGAVLGVTSKIGRLYMMIAFGALFGNTVLGRMTLLIGRIKFILIDWLHLAG
ncbi:hypothetical protein IMX26_09590 [Clostridium sp. 'deep sea']|uniref:hypothetical protein n=1 Tax=Clostridium sp. 'deep sea' TaxID=2779445 RepID=UPI0018966466|nr:hypothetical protein [Clostridium sp. 'deep sea']QOR33754.1 hypothetical protein IMX26_09590 [Clostridium sp. 'deep sea']